MARTRKRKVIMLNDKLYDLNGVEIGKAMTKGWDNVKSKETVNRLLKLVGGSLMSNVAVILTNKLINPNAHPAFQYGVGTVASGVITVGALGLGYTDVGFGSGLVTANQLINTGTSLVTGKNLNQLLTSK